MDRSKAIELLKKYNKEEFHLRHALTVEGVMKYFAKEANEDIDYWGLVGLLHDVDFEMWPEEHCKKAPELLKEMGLVKKQLDGIKVLGNGKLSKKLTVKAHKFSEKAKEEIDHLG